MAQQDFKTILHTLERLTASEKLALIERLAHSLRESAVVNGLPAQQRTALQRLRRDLASLPICNPADGVSNRDHDRLLYGAP